VYVEVRGAYAQVGDADNCQALDVRVVGGDRGQVDAALRAAGLGRWDGAAEAELSVSGLHDAAAVAGVGADWPERWAAMMRYAESKGWLTADGTHLRAHLVNTD
jgi:hypothetical protein